MEILTEKADEESSFTIKNEFFNEAGDAFEPITLTWTLTDTGANVINSRDAVTVVTPEDTEYIGLSGDDLSIPERLGEVLRILTLQGTFSSLYSGAQAKFKKQIGFYIKNLTIVT